MRQFVKLSILVTVLFALVLSNTSCASSCSCNNPNKATTAAQTTAATTAASTTEQTTAPTTQAATTTAPTTTTEAPTTTPPTEPTIAPATKVKSFGRLTNPDIAAINEATLSNEKSGVVDVLEKRTYTNTEVKEMIESYDSASFTASVSEAVKVSRNLEPLTANPTAEASLQYGILVTNADVRSFPTNDIILREGTNFDLLQETKLLYASGVVVLHQTTDKTWSFVQGTNYFGWVETTSIGLTDYDTMADYLTHDNFIVSMTASGDQPFNRLGVVLPYESKSSKESGYLALLPAKDQKGNFKTQQYLLTTSNNNLFNDGFMNYSQEAVVAQMVKNLSLSYSWGDKNIENGQGYDCSSTVNGVYSLFGIILPRNSSAEKYSGLTVVDLTGKTAAEKLAAMKGHEGAILVMPGHVMMYERDKNILHNTTRYSNNKELTDIVEPFKVVRSDMTKIYHATNGTLILDAITTLIYK